MLPGKKNIDFGFKHIMRVITHNPKPQHNVKNVNYPVIAGVFDVKSYCRVLKMFIM